MAQRLQVGVGIAATSAPRDNVIDISRRHQLVHMHAEWIDAKRMPAQIHRT